MTNTLHRARPMARRWTVAVLSLSGVAVVAACGSSGTSGSANSSAPASAPVTSAAAPNASSSSGIPCAQITALRSTLTDLSHQQVSPTSAGRISADLTKAEQELAALKSQGAGAFSAQANQLTTALDTIKKDAAALATNPTATNLTNLTGAVTSFKATAMPLIKEMQTVCPTS